MAEQLRNFCVLLPVTRDMNAEHRTCFSHHKQVEEVGILALLFEVNVETDNGSGAIGNIVNDSIDH